MTAFALPAQDRPDAQGAAAVLNQAYRDELQPDSLHLACAAFLKVARDDRASADLKSNALLHLGDRFGECGKALGGRMGDYSSAADIYRSVIGVNASPEISALAANDLAASIFQTNLREAIDVLAKAPWGQIAASRRAAYEINLAHLYQRNNQPDAAFRTFRTALEDGAESQTTVSEMVQLVPILQSNPSTQDLWVSLMDDTTRRLLQNGKLHECISLLQASFHKRFEDPAARRLTEILLRAYAALAPPLDQFLTEQTKLLEATGDPWLQGVSAAAADTLDVPLGESGIPSKFLKFISPELKTSPKAATSKAGTLLRAVAGSVPIPLFTLSETDYPLRAAFSLFLLKIGDAYASSARSDAVPQSAARYMMATIAWPPNLPAAVRAAAVSQSGAALTKGPDVLHTLQERYDTTGFDFANLTDNDLRNLLELHLYLAAGKPEADTGVLERAAQIRGVLLQRKAQVNPIPSVLRELARRKASSASKSASDQKASALLYLEAAHDYERNGDLAPAEDCLLKAGGLDPKINAFLHGLTEGQHAIVGMLQHVPHITGMELDVRVDVTTTGVSRTLPGVKMYSLQPGEPEFTYFVTLPEPLSAGSAVQVMATGTVGTHRFTIRQANATIPKLPTETTLRQAEEGELVVYGTARPGVRAVRVEVRLPRSACGSTVPKQLDRSTPLFLQAATAVVNSRGIFNARLARGLRDGETITVRELSTTNNDTPRTASPVEVGKGSLSGRFFRFYLRGGVEFFDPVGPGNFFIAPTGSGTAEVTIHQWGFAIPHPMCYSVIKPGPALAAVVYEEGRIEPVTAGRGPGTTPTHSLIGAAVETGLYVPYTPAKLRLQFNGKQLGLFGGPIVRVGRQTGAATGGSGRYWAAGLRLGAWELNRSDGKSAPILLTHYDFTVGRWDSFFGPIVPGMHVPLRYEFSAVGQIVGSRGPNPISIGGRINFGPGPEDYRISAGIRYELSDLLHRLRREGLAGILH